MPGMIIPPNGNTVPSQRNIDDNISHLLKQQATSKTLNTKPAGKEHFEGKNAKTLLSTLATINSNPSQQQQQKPPTTGEALANGLQLCVAPVRRYKQYTEETLQQALREIMEGQR